MRYHILPDIVDRPGRVGGATMANPIQITTHIDRSTRQLIVHPQCTDKSADVSLCHPVGAVMRGDLSRELGLRHPLRQPVQPVYPF